MPTILLETGKKIKIPDGLSKNEIEAIVEDATSKISSAVPRETKERKPYIPTSGFPSLDKAGNIMQALSRPLARAATGGLSSYGEDIGRYLADKLSGGKGTFEEAGERRRQFDIDIAEALPGGQTTSAALEFIPSMVTSGGAFKLASKLPLIRQGLASSKVIPNLLAALGRGTAVTGGLAATDPDFELTGKTAALGGGLDVGTMALGKFAPHAGKIIKVAPTILRKTARAIPGLSTVEEGISKWIQEFKKGKFEKGVEQFSKKTGTENLQVSGREAQEGLQSLFSQASEKYHHLKSGMLKKFGGNRVSAETLRKGMVDELDGISELAGDLDPSDAALKKVLGKWQERLRKNPTLQELDDLATTLYKASQKPNSNPAYKRLYESARENLLDAMDESVVASGQRSRLLTEAESQSKKLGRAQAGLIEEARQPLKGQRHIEEIGRARETISKEQQQIENMIEDLTSDNELKGAQAREAYRLAREEIAKHLKLKKGSIGKLAKSEYPEQVVTGAIGKGKLDTASAIEAGLSANPEFKIPLRKAVIGDIMQKAGSQKTLKNALDSYSEVLPKILSQEEMSELIRLSGKNNLMPSVWGSFFKKISGPVGSGARISGMQAIKQFSE